MQQVPDAQHGPNMRMEAPKSPPSSPPDKPADTSEDTSGGTEEPVWVDPDSVPSAVDDGVVQDAGADWDYSTEAEVTVEKKSFEGNDIESFRDSQEPGGY